MSPDWLRAQQQRICAAHQAQFLESPAQLKIGLSREARAGASPLNGLRYEPEADTTGWFIWSGAELSEAPDFFEPHDVGRLPELLPEVLPYLGLAPGWRFLLAPGQVEVWFDPALLDPA